MTDSPGVDARGGGLMDDKTWLDVMPAIPLDRAVPVVWFEVVGHDADNKEWAVRSPGIVVEAVRSALDAMVVVQPEDLGEDLEEMRATDLRVDLNDPQGFAYALRVSHGAYLAACAGRWPSVDEAPLFIEQDIVLRHLRGTTSDLDRVEVARALALAVERNLLAED